jgi:3-hydroxybutyrate dehydrogenase
MGVTSAELAGRVALVTGGTRGIGLGIAAAMVTSGASVVVAGRDIAAGERATAALGGGAEYVAADVTDGVSVDAMVEEVIARLGRLDILVNNAGGTEAARLMTDLTDDDWERALKLNLTSVFRASRRAIPYMSANGWGRVINISSFRAKQPTAGQGAYAVAKAGVIALTKALACEVGDSGVTVNTIAPGVVLTEMALATGASFAAAEGITADERWERYRRTIPSRRLATPEAIGALAVFLASDAAACLSGSCYNADGGLADH